MSQTPDVILPRGTQCCVTGAAGFIGSHLVEELLRQDLIVVGLDNLSTGHSVNLEEVRSRVTSEQWARFRFVSGDIRSRPDLAVAVADAELVFHEAALASVPQSLAEPVVTHETNVTGFVNVLEAARGAGVRRVVYASSSAVYGDSEEQPAREDRIGAALSPYAASKRINEEYAALFERCYGLSSVGLRYFNVFGPRQDPAGAYAAVIPRWIEALMRDEVIQIFGDGETSRDFCPVASVVQANLLAATTALPPEAPRVFNVGLGRATTLNQLAEAIRASIQQRLPSTRTQPPVHAGFRAGDVRHSQADISAARRWLGFAPADSPQQGLDLAVDWYARRSSAPRNGAAPAAAHGF